MVLKGVPKQGKVLFYASASTWNQPKSTKGLCNQWFGYGSRKHNEQCRPREGNRSEFNRSAILRHSKIFPSLKKVESNYLHKGSNNILPNPVDFDYSAPITFPPSGQEIPNPNTVPTSLKFEGLFQTRFTNNIEFNTATVADLQGSSV